MALTVPILPHVACLLHSDACDGSPPHPRKDNLARNISRCRRQFGDAPFSFVPHSYILPQETQAFGQGPATCVAVRDAGRRHWTKRCPENFRNIDRFLPKEGPGITCWVDFRSLKIRSTPCMGRKSVIWVMPLFRWGVRAPCTLSRTVVPVGAA